MSPAGLRERRTSRVETTLSDDSGGHTLQRGLTWKDAFWVTSLFPADAAVLQWQLTIADLGFVKPGLSLRINATFIIASILLFITFKLQHSGAPCAARAAAALKIWSAYYLAWVR
ncbi:protein of unknown function [Burkholderia multivorans]